MRLTVLLDPVSAPDSGAVLRPNPLGAEAVPENHLSLMANDRQPK